jgi:lipopolysaccharide/colanic/teichoic acid biosynthesis glycosyltransferase
MDAADTTPQARRARGLAVKAAFDRSAAAVLLVAALPLMAAIALLIGLTLGRPIFFRQKRSGFRAVPFDLVKFRTMRDTRGNEAERLTAVGRFLRSLSLDELPELVNVLRGEMSLVGPRPLILRYLDRYTPEQARRHDMKPGLTGWSQVNGRNALSWADKFALDVWYVDHWSLLLDLRILALTPIVVLTRRGVTAPGAATSHEFLGTAKAPRPARPEETA